MKKIRLDLDTLAVESFETAREGGDLRGTVRGHLAITPDSGGGVSRCDLCTGDPRCMSLDGPCPINPGGDTGTL